MSRVVYLHVGAPKTGTTYLQDRLTLNARELARRDVHFPRRSPLVSPPLSQFRAALDLLGQDWGGPPGHAAGHYEPLMRRIRKARGTVIVSHEILAPARPEHVARVMGDLGDSEVHVVYSARDLSRALPAAYQESIKQGRTWTFRQFLRRARRGKPWFYRAFNIPAVFDTWGADLPPERLHLVTVPRRGGSAGGASTSGDDPLFLRFCTAFGIDPAWAPQDSDLANKSLGVTETQLVRQLNRRLARTVKREAPYDVLVRDLAQKQLVHRESPAVTLPPSAYDWVEEVTESWIEYVEDHGIDVVGDLADLRPVRPDDDEPWHNPDKVPARKRLDASLDALAAMTREAASRPAPDRSLTHRVRDRAERVWPG